MGGESPLTKPDGVSETPGDRRPGISRRSFLQLGAALGGAAVVGVPALAAAAPALATGAAHGTTGAMGMGTVGNLAFDGREPVDPDHYLTAFNTCEFAAHRDWYKETVRPDGTLLREYEIVAYDKEIEIAPGIFFPAWTYNGQVPGPTIRATVGDRIRIRFRNEGSHPHTIHFHGWHPSGMDGSFPDQQVSPGEEFLYEFDAEPVGLHLYHCHTFPLKAHIHKGLYGAFIIDPKTPRPPALELVMTMNGFDTNFDGENEVYAVNSVAFHHMHSPISVKVGETVRIYLLNLTEFDPVNSFHLHASFFDVFRTGTRTESDEFTDTVHFGQGERAILEFKFRWPGRYMFHAHQSEFAELGWMGLFEAHG